LTSVQANHVRWCRDRTVMRAVDGEAGAAEGATAASPLRVGIILGDGQAHPLMETTVGRFWLEDLYRALFARPDCEAVERVTFEVPASPATEETKSWD